MSDRDDKQLNQDSELSQLRSLVSDAEESLFSLDDILAEYSKRKPPTGVITLSEPKPPKPKSAPAPASARKVVPFPGTVSAPAHPAETAPEPESERPQEETPDNVVDFPEEQNPISSLLHSLSQKADDYAQNMFEGDELAADPEARRMEELIPGVDKEDASPSRRRTRRQDPPEPDTPPQDLARRYGKGLRFLRVRIFLVFFLFLPALYLLLEPMLPLPPIPNPWAPSVPLLTDPLRIWISAGLLGTAMLLSVDILWIPVRRLARLRLGMDTLLLLACISTLIDALTMQYILPREQLPYCALNILALFFALQGEHHRKRGLRLACRTAAAAKQPYLVTLDEGKWNGRDTYAKHSGTPDGFGSQIRADDGAQRIFRIFCPLLLMACIAFSLLSSVGLNQPQRLAWCLSATFTAAAALPAPLLFSRPFHKLARRLIHSGGALAGWPGAANSRRGAGILLTDYDLFPPGSVALNGIKIFGDWSVERVIGYTGTLIHSSGSGLDKLFYDLMRTQGAVYREAERLCCYEGGGVSATIRGSQVLVGSAAFMNLMEVALPQGLNVKNAVFCAIDGDLAGIFALNYSLPDLVFPSIDALLQEKISPVLATRDFNLIPAMLRQRFKLAAERMDFPPVERRRELSAPDQEHNKTLTAVLCREGLYPFSETVVGARRLRLSVRLGAVVCCAGSVLGVLLAYYLTGAGAFASISPLNLLLYLILWMIPCWLIIGWTNQY